MICDRILLNARRKCGRKKKTTSRDNTYICGQSKNYPSEMSDALNTDWKEKDIQISSFAIHRRLIAVRQKARRTVKKQLLSKAIKENEISGQRSINIGQKTVNKSFLTMKVIFFAQGQSSQHF